MSREIDMTWDEFKDISAKKNLMIQFTVSGNRYEIWATDISDIYQARIRITDPVVEGSEQEDFETNYKASCNQPLEQRNDEGRVIVMTTSRPLNATTYFTGEGDDVVNQKIGGGTRLFYDFSDDDDLITAPAGYKRKRIDVEFIDPTWIKDGAAYFHNTLKGSYVDLFIVCPAGGYYKKNDGSYALASEDTPVEHFCNKLYMQGDCPMGDELNTETCSQQIPASYIYRLEVTVPDSDNVSNGYYNLELYRERTVIL